MLLVEVNCLGIVPQGNVSIAQVTQGTALPSTIANFPGDGQTLLVQVNGFGIVR